MRRCQRQSRRFTEGLCGPAKILIASLLWCLASSFVEAQEAAAPRRHWNVPLPTLGGQQFWTDHRWNDGWRLQQNALTGHWRVLDARDVRRAWGSREACLEALGQLHPPSVATAEQLEPVGDVAQPATPAVVILLHGLMRSSDSMAPLERAFKARGDATAIHFSYASTRASVDEHAMALREFVENLPGRPKISFVGHSLGNIVVRRALDLWQREGDAEQVLPRLHRIVMLGPPNQGSSIARRLAHLGLFETITGSSGQELGAAWDQLQQRLATPPCPFCIIAGDLSDSSLKNPLVSGKSDFVVSLEETRLDGASEYVTLPVLHSFLMSDSAVQAATLRFIEPLPFKQVE